MSEESKRSRTAIPDQERDEGVGELAKGQLEPVKKAAAGAFTDARPSLVPVTPGDNNE